MTPFRFTTAPAVVFAAGAAAPLPDDAVARLGPRVLVVTDPGIRRLDLCGPTLASRCSTPWAGRSGCSARMPPASTP